MKVQLRYVTFPEIFCPTSLYPKTIALRDKKTTREEGVAEIARRYGKFVDVFEAARAS
jgi:hypothetical protein